jgi:hypothetical protein
MITLRAYSDQTSERGIEEEGYEAAAALDVMCGVETTPHGDLCTFTVDA